MAGVLIVTSFPPNPYKHKYIFMGLQSHEYIQSEYGENCDLFTKYGYNEQNHLANYNDVEGDGGQQKCGMG